MITLLALAAINPDADPLARYDAFRAAHPTIEVSVTASINGKQRMAGDITIEPPRRFIYRAKFGGYNYSLASSEKTYVEIENASHVYDELPPISELAAFSSEINPTANGVLPRFLFINGLKAQFPSKGAQITHKDGYDEEYVKVNAPGGFQEYWVDVDSQGKILMMRQHAKSPMGNITSQWNLFNYRYPTVGLSTFVTPLPLGYLPHSLPRLGTPLQIGKPAPVSGWTTASGAHVDLSSIALHKPFLIAVLGADSTPSNSARASLPAIKIKVPVFVVGPGGLSDPSGKLMAKLSVPATPMFYLIDEAGKVKKLWEGYDPGEARAFEQDVIQTATGTGATK